MTTPAELARTSTIRMAAAHLVDIVARVQPITRGGPYGQGFRFVPDASPDRPERFAGARGFTLQIPLTAVKGPYTFGPRRRFRTVTLVVFYPPDENDFEQTMVMVEDADGIADAFLRTEDWDSELSRIVAISLGGPRILETKLTPQVTGGRLLEIAVELDTLDQA